jgi:hypothetical protein
MKIIKFLSSFTILALISFIPLTTPAQAENTPTYVCDTTTFPAGDDSSFQMNLPFSLALGDTTYTNVYASINGLLSFGVADGTFSDYPQTPSISVAGNDWVTWGNGAYLRYGTTDNTLCIQWAVRPYPQSTGELTHIDLKVVRASNGGWDGSITSSGPLPNTLRRGIRFQSGQAVVPIQETFTVNGGRPVETHTCWDNSVIPVGQNCAPEPTPTIQTRTVQCTWTNPYTQAQVEGTASQHYYLYWNNRTEDIDTVSAACIAAIPTFPIPAPTIETRQVPCTGNNPVDNSPVSWMATQRYNLFWDGSTEDLETSTEVCIASDPNLNNVDSITVLANGVELTVTVAQALELFNSPSDLINAIFSNPSQVATAIMNLGADMTPAQRKQSQQAIVPAIVVSQIISSTSAVTMIKRTSISAPNRTNTVLNKGER